MSLALYSRCSMANEEITAQSLAREVKLLQQASKAITKALAVVPEKQLFTAVLRRFRVWPYRDSLSIITLTPILQTVVDQVRATVHAEMAALGVGRFADQKFDPWVVSGVPDDLRKRLGAPCPRGVLGTVAISGEKIRIKDIRSHPDYRGLPPGHPPISSFMAIPIRFESLSLGNLYVANKLGEDEFTEQDESIVETLSTMAAFAIQQTYFQATLESRHSQMQSLLDSVPSGVIFLDKASGYITANDAAMELFQRPLIEVTGGGRYVEIVLSQKGEVLSVADHPVVKALSGQTILGEEMLIKRADGTIVPVRLNTAPVIGAYGEVIGAVVVFDNIALEKSLEEMRRLMNTMVIHDIRSPIQAVLLNAQVIEKMTNIDSSIKARVQNIEDNAKRVVALTNRLLDVSRIETANVNLQLRVVDIGEMVKSTVNRVSGAYGGRRIDVQVPEQSIRAKVDVERMDDVVANLIDNAVKYSRGNTAIEVVLSPDKNGFELSVKDHGVGIEPETLQHLFEPYKRGRVAKVAATQGMGLGLFIVKGIVEAHGGTVHVESEVGKGSVFRLVFPSQLLEQNAAA